MSTLVVTYPRSPGKRFDRDYWQNEHARLATATWSEFGLLGTELLFSDDPTQPFVAMTIIRFRDQASIDAALSSPTSAGAMADVANFTDIVPVAFRSDSGS